MIHGPYNIKYVSIFHENPSNGSRVTPCGQTDGYDKSNSRFFAIFGNAPKNRAFVGELIYTSELLVFQGPCHGLSG